MADLERFAQVFATRNSLSDQSFKLMSSTHVCCNADIADSQFSSTSMHAVPSQQQFPLVLR